ncbi:TatD family hydrolase, partial [Vibrio sp. FNV 38]|nr:TatD family hydrolase [Vibrio sp. FNV 38]
MKIIDSHCHLCDERYTDVAAEVRRFEEGGVLAAINAAYSVKSSFIGKDLAERFPSVFFTAGIHPDNPHSATEENLNQLLALSKHEKCVAIGEIGLDYH